MSNTHNVTFSNLIDSKTGNPVKKIEVPNNLQYEGGRLFAQFSARQVAKHVLSALNNPDPDEMV